MKKAKIHITPRNSYSGISETLKNAIELIKNSLGKPPIPVKLLSKKMYRLPPSKYAKAGHLGIDIQVFDIKTFLGQELHAENMILYPSLATDYVMELLREHHPELFNKTDKTMKQNQNEKKTIK